MVSDGLFSLGAIVTVSGLFWWYPPAAVTIIGVSLILLAYSIHKGAPRGKTD